MIDVFNIIGLLNLFFSLLTIYIIIIKFGNSNFIALGWFGLFIYSIPVFINFSRKIYYSEYDANYLITPPVESKLIYFVFWIGFLISILIYNQKNFTSFKIDKVNIHLNIFQNLCL